MQLGGLARLLFARRKERERPAATLSYLITTLSAIDLLTGLKMPDAYISDSHLSAKSELCEYTICLMFILKEAASGVTLSIRFL